MAATIDIRLQDNSKEWVAAQKAAFLAAGGSAEDFEKHLESLNKEFQSRASADAAANVKKLADEYDKLNGVVRESTGALDKSTQGWMKMQSQVMVFREAFSWIKAGFQGISRAAQQAAEDGNASFMKLTKSAEKFWEALGNWDQSRVLSELAEELSNEQDGIVPLIHRVGNGADWAFGRMQAGLKEATRGWMILGEQVGWVRDGTVRAFDDEGRSRQRAADQRAKDAAAADKEFQKEKKRREELAKFDAINPGAGMRQDAEIAKWIDGFQDVEKATEEINHLLDVQAKLFDKIKAKGRDPTQDAKFIQNQKDLIALESKRMELEREHAQWLKDEDDKRFQRRWEEQEKRIRWEKEVAQAGIESERAKFLAAEARREADAAAEKKKVDDLAAFFGGGQQQGGMGQGPNLMAQIQGGIKPNAMRDQIIKQRQDKALQAWREQQTSTGQMDQNGNLIGYDGESMGLMGRRTKAQEAAIMRQARMNAFRDARRGGITQEETATAQGALMQATSQMLGKGSNVDSLAVKAIKQLTQQAGQQAQDAARNADTLGQVLQQLAVLGGRSGNATQRAQMTGGGR